MGIRLISLLTLVALFAEPLVVFAETEEDSYVPGELIIKFDEDTTDVGQSDVAPPSLGDDISLSAKEYLPEYNLALYTALGSDDMEALADIAEELPGVEYAEPNYVRDIEVVPNDLGFFRQWSLVNTGQDYNPDSSAIGTPGVDIDWLSAYASSTGNGVIVAVIDTGVEYGHVDLALNMWDGTSCLDENGAPLGGCIHGYDFMSTTTGDRDPEPGLGPIPQHGTLVTGIIAADADNGIGLAGVAPDATIMALRFQLSVASEIKAINFARENGAKVINASFGGFLFSQAEQDAIEAFTDAGGIFVAAAGNGGSDRIGDDDDVIPFYPASLTLPGIISVTATDDDDALAPFSNYGDESVDLSAPGVTIYTTNVSGTYVYGSGTSMATPMVSGAVALLMSAYPSASPSEIKQAILDSVDPVPPLSGKTVSGGRLNVYAALRALEPDVAAPVITLLGDNPMTIAGGTTFVDPGAEVTDDTDPTTTILGSGTVNTGSTGTYTLTYDATDSSGNAASTVTRTVIVERAAPSGGGGGGGGGSSNNDEDEDPERLPAVLGTSTYSFTTTLALGSTGNEVEELQKKLTALGFYTGPLTGYFGPLTEAAVRALQSAHGLEPVGVVGPKTRTLLNGGVASISIAEQIAAIVAQIAFLEGELAKLESE